MNTQQLETMAKYAWEKEDEGEWHDSPHEYPDPCEGCNATFGPVLVRLPRTVGDLITARKPVDEFEGQTCRNCKQRPATLKWVGTGSSMDLIHGNYSLWCRMCSVEAQLAYAQEQAARIGSLENELAELREEEANG